jgi:hypothetical protein
MSGTAAGMFCSTAWVALAASCWILARRLAACSAVRDCAKARSVGSITAPAAPVQDPSTDVDLKRAVLAGASSTAAATPSNRMLRRAMGAIGSRGGGLRGAHG